MSLTPFGDLLIAIKADIDDYQKAAATAGDVSRTLGGTFASLGRMIRNTGAALTAFGVIAGVATAGIARSGERVSMAYREVQSIVGGTTDVAAEFGEQVRNVTTELGVQGGQVATLDALYRTISAGITDAGDAMEVVEQSAQLATVGITDMETSVDVLTTTLNAYGMEADEVETVSDQLFTTIRVGDMRMEELAQAIGPVLALAAPLGVELKDVGAGMAFMADSGFSARRAATALRAAIRSLIRPNQDLLEVLTELAMDGMIELTDQQQEALTNYQEEQAELQELQAEYREVSMAVNDLRGDYDDLNSQMRENNIEIRKIRLQARKEGRELTEEEEEQIENLRIQNDELRIQQMELREEIDEKQDAEEEARQAVEEQEEQAESAEETWEQFAEQLGQTMLENQGLGQSITMVADKADEMNMPLQTAIRNIRALQLALPVTRDEGEQWQENLEEIGDSQGVVSEQMEKFQEETTFEYRQAINAIRGAVQELGLELGEQLAPILEGVADRFERFTRFVEDLPEQLKSGIAQFSVLITVLALVMGPLMLFGGQLITIIGLLGPKGLLAGLLVLTPAAAIFASHLRDMTSSSDEAEESLQDFQERVQNIVDVVMDFAQSIRDNILPGLADLGDGIREWVDTAVEQMEEFSDGGDHLVDTFDEITEIIGDALSAAGEWLEENTHLIEGTFEVAEEINDNMIPAVMDLVDATMGVVEILEEWTEGMDVMIDMEIVLSAMAASAIVLSEIVADLTHDIAEWIRENERLVAGLVAVMTVVALKPAILAAIGAAFVYLIWVIGDFLGIWSVLADLMFLKFRLIAIVVGAVWTMFEAFMALPRPIQLIAAFLLGPLALGIMVIVTLIDMWANDTLWLQTIITGAFGVIADMFSFMVDMARVGFEVIQDVISQFGQVINGTVDSAVRDLQRIADAFSFLLRIHHFATAFMIGLLVILARAYRNRVVEPIVGLLQTLAETTSSIAVRMKNAYLSWLSFLQSVGERIIGFVRETLLEFWENEWVQRIVGAVEDVISEYQDFVEDVEEIYDDLTETTDDNLEEFKDLVDQHLIEPVEDLKETFRELVDTVIGFIQDAIEDQLGSEWVEFIDEEIAQPIQDLIDRAEDWGESFLESFTTGIENKLSEFKEAVRQVAEEGEAVLGTNSDTEEGPWSNLTDWGGAFVATIANAIENEMDTLGDAAMPPGLMDPNAEGFGGGGTNIEVDFTIEDGAFRGVADEEIPELVGEEIDQRFDDIIDEVRGSGQ